MRCVISHQSRSNATRRRVPAVTSEIVRPNRRLGERPNTKHFTSRSRNSYCSPGRTTGGTPAAGPQRATDASAVAQRLTGRPGGHAPTHPPSASRNTHRNHQRYRAATINRTRDISCGTSDPNAITPPGPRSRMNGSASSGYNTSSRPRRGLEHDHQVQSATRRVPVARVPVHMPGELHHRQIIVASELL